MTDQERDAFIAMRNALDSIYEVDYFEGDSGHATVNIDMDLVNEAERLVSEVR